MVNSSDTTQSGSVSDLLPDVDFERCVHSKVVAASCRACVEACPVSAWVMGEAALGIDTEACDGCGICVAACPQSAIHLDLPSPAVALENRQTVMFACEIAVSERGIGVRPCLHAVGLDELAQLYAQGMRRIVLSRGDCTACKRSATLSCDQALGDLGVLLDDRALPEVSVDERPATDWRAERASLTQATRRDFLMALRPRNAETGPAKKNPEPAPAAQALPPGTVDTPLNPYLMRIDAELCVACDACSRICSHQAIRLNEGGDVGDCYELYPRSCTGCGLCVDVCDAGAITIEQWQRASVKCLHLDRKQCKACGNVFRIPSDRDHSAALCSICTTTGHNRKLFQVLE